MILLTAARPIDAGPESHPQSARPIIIIIIISSIISIIIIIIIIIIISSSSSSSSSDPARSFTELRYSYPYPCPKGSTEFLLYYLSCRNATFCRILIL